MNNALGKTSGEPRIPPLAPENWEPGLLDDIQAFGKGAVKVENNVYGTLANYPSLFRAWTMLGSHLLRRSSLSPRLRELVILRTVLLSKGRYPYSQHRRLGLQVGLTEAEIAALETFDPTAWQSEERTLLVAVNQLHYGFTLDDAAFESLSAQFSIPQILDAVGLVCFYRLAAWMLNIARAQLQEGDQAFDFGGVAGAAEPGEGAYAGATRLDRIDPDQWPAELLVETATWPRFKEAPHLRAAGVYCTFVQHPELFRSIGGLMAHILSHNSLDDQMREIVIIRACARARGAYPFRQHMRIGRNAGLSEPVLKGISQRHPSDLPQPAALLVTMVDTCFDQNDFEDELWDQAQNALSREQILDVVLVSGFYGLISTVLNVARTPLEEGADDLSDDFYKDG